MKKVLKTPLTRFFIYSLFGFFAGGIIFVACQKELTVLSQTDSTDALNKQKILDAKTWFEKIQKESNDSNLLKLILIWDSAQFYNHSILLKIKWDLNKVHHPSLFKDEKLSGREYVLINNLKGNFEAEIIQFIPSKYFTGKIDNINIKNYTELSFDGFIFSKNLYGNYLKVYEIKSGELIKSFTPKSNSNSLTNQTLEYVCFPTINNVCYYVDDCCVECYFYEGAEMCFDVDPSRPDNPYDAYYYNGVSKCNCQNGFKTQYTQTYYYDKFAWGKMFKQIAQYRIALIYGISDCSIPNYTLRADPLFSMAGKLSFPNGIYTQKDPNPIRVNQFNRSCGFNTKDYYFAYSNYEFSIDASGNVSAGSYGTYGVNGKSSFLESQSVGGYVTQLVN